MSLSLNQVERLDPRTSSDWLKLVQSYESGVFASPAWLRVLGKTYDFDVSAYVVRDSSGAVVAGIPYCEIDDIFGKRIVGLPFSDFSDPIVSSPEHWTLLSEALLAHQAPVTLRPLHNVLPLDDPNFDQVNKAKWHGLDLTPEVEELRANLHPQTRRGLNKSQREGVEIIGLDDLTGMRQFFELHLGIRKNKYRLLAQPYSFFANIWKCILQEQAGVLFAARYDGRFIAMAMFLAWKDTFHYKFSASLSEYLKLRVPDRLIWEGISYAKENGFSAFDMGLSDWDQTGLVEYKRKFNPQEKTISFLRHNPMNNSSAKNTNLRPWLPRATRLFTQPWIPDGLTEGAGAALYRYFT
ncbi:MAG: GNAT family N-acetyltransferase [Chloroflexi bacterium]|nr:MAG: GNAT family N-acetyltransferase [Chloroflexota bacterium]MBL1193695.1 GNAT family N-acetyltransferase [Chloroflexota bacterium]NOH10988.1 GNAT family N-acetyltransferase [Chloroflexota bacterium]